MPGISLKDNQWNIVKLNPKSEAGNPVPLDGVPSWESMDPDIIIVEPAEDGMSAKVMAVGNVGVTQLKIVADADPGPDVREISAVINVEVTPSDAVALGVCVGEPQDKDD